MDEFIVDHNEEFWDDGIEDSEEVVKNQSKVVPEVILGKYIEELVQLGIFYHDSSEVITSGGMRDTIVFLRYFFDIENFISFLISLPIQVIEKFSGLIHSDEIHDEDMIHEVLGLFNREVSTNSDLSFIVYYADLYYSDLKFTDLMRNMLKATRDSVRLNLSSLSTEQEIKDYTELVEDHRKYVSFIVNQILEKSELPFDKAIVLSILDNHDKDLLYPEKLNFFALDKGLFGGPYHKFSKHPAIDNFYSHKVSSFHHIECYLMNEINLEDQFEKYINYIPGLISDVYEVGITLEIFKTHVKNIFQLLNPNEEFLNKIDNILNLISELPS